jgi:hypothetical protein
VYVPRATAALVAFIRMHACSQSVTRLNRSHSTLPMLVFPKIRSKKV